MGRNNPNHSYSIDCSPIQSVDDSVRDLGFIITPDLSLKTHAKKVVAKAKYKTFNLFRQLKIHDQDAWVKIFTTYIRPIAEFGSTIINGYPDVAKLFESIQNDFTRKLFLRLGAPNYRSIPPPSGRNATLGLDSLQSRRDIADFKMMNKLLAPNSILDASQFFSFRPSITRGQSAKLSFPRARGRLRGNFFTCRMGSKYLRYSKRNHIPKTSLAIKNMLTNRPNRTTSAH